MCGIVSMWNKGDPNAVVHMMDAMEHRGPDDQGLYISDAGILGHRRLSIMDPEGGKQPIASLDSSKAIVANGEIYNFPLLYKELRDRHTFTTRSDSESILHLYEDSGVDACSRLDGMFAFAIADGNDLFAARDPVGIKPLYIGKKNEQLILGSELKAMAQHVDELREFPPGSYFHSRHGFKKFRAIPRHAPEELDVETSCRLIRRTLEESVRKRLMSDVPLGAFLSGGLDSSLIAAIARRHLPELHTFSVGMQGSRDLEAARLVSRHIDSIHHEYVITPEDVHRHLSEIVFFLESFDQDLVRSAIPCYFVSRLAAEQVKVILTGEGADELFAGYAYCKDESFNDMLHDELYRSVTALHNINLQRVDRLTMAHSIEGRVPFLDLNMIAMAQRVPLALKLRRVPGKRPVEKWILRKAFEDLLPHEIIWRVKEQFDEGSGTVDFLGQGLERFLPHEQAVQRVSAYARDRLRSPEEAVYHKLLSEAFTNPRPVLDNVARWCDNRVAG